VLLAANYVYMGACARAFGSHCYVCALAGGDGASLGVAADLSCSQSPPCVGMTPTFTRGNCRMAVLLPGGDFNLLRIQDAGAAHLPARGLDGGCGCRRRAFRHQLQPRGRGVAP